MSARPGWKFTLAAKSPARSWRGSSGSTKSHIAKFSPSVGVYWDNRHPTGKGRWGKPGFLRGTRENAAKCDRKPARAARASTSVAPTTAEARHQRQSEADERSRSRFRNRDDVEPAQDRRRVAGR